MGHALQKTGNCHTSVPQIFTSSLGLVPPPSPYDELIATVMDALLCNLPATGSEMHWKSAGTQAVEASSKTPVWHSP